MRTSLAIHRLSKLDFRLFWHTISLLKKTQYSMKNGIFEILKTDFARVSEIILKL